MQNNPENRRTLVTVMGSWRYLKGKWKKREEKNIVYNHLEGALVVTRAIASKIS